MEIRFGFNAAKILMVLFHCSATATPMSADAPTAEVKLESQDLEVVQGDNNTSSSTNESSSLSYRFQCIVKGLSAEQLAKLTESDELDENVVINVYGAANSSNERDDFEGKRPYNIHFKAVNDTLVISGEIKANKSDSGKENGDGSLPISRCDVVFLNEKEKSRSLIPEGKSLRILINSPRPLPFRPSPPDNKVYYHNIYDLSQRSKRHMWLWKIKKVHDRDPYSRPYGSYERPYGSYERPYGYPESPYRRRPHNHRRRICSRYPEDRYESHTRYPEHSYRPHDRYPGGPYKGYSSEESGVDGNNDMQKLVNLIAERLDLADKVAIHKFDEDLPVEDLPREEIILGNMIRQAENRGLDSRWAKRFFCDQIEGNKEIQYDLIEEWRRRGCRPPGPPVDLRNDIRPRIDLINDELIELLKRTEYERREWNCRKEVERSSRYAAFRFDFDALHVRALQRATANVCERTRRSSHSSYPLFPNSRESNERDYYPL